MYDTPVNFTTTGRYGCCPISEDDVYTIEEFKEFVSCGMFIDYDGYGHPIKDRLADYLVYIYPSKINNIPKEATYIVWFNR